jgi:hypothetical protein
MWTACRPAPVTALPNPFHPGNWRGNNVRIGMKEIALSLTEYNILKLLAANAGKRVTCKYLLKVKSSIALPFRANLSKLNRPSAIS